MAFFFFLRTIEVCVPHLFLAADLNEKPEKKACWFCF